MKIKSLRLILEDALTTAKRFPFTIISAVTAAVAMIVILETKHGGHDIATKIAMSAFLGISILTGIAVASETLFSKKSYTLIAGIIGLLVLVGYYFTIEIYPAHYYRLALFLAAAHLFVAISFSLRRKDQDEFWLFNKSMLLRILLAAFYTHILYSGIALAIFAVKNLFNVKFNDEIYAELYLVLACVFNTFFFLSGVMSENTLAGLKVSFPKPLKIFVQYILFPIAGIYLLILYVYFFKIIFTWQLPNGWVSSLVIAYSIVGILAYLLIHPLREDSESRWIKIYSRWFFITLIPLLALMTVAIWVRISDYGITESRYFGIITNAWLYGISLYFILSKKQLIKAIPISLLVLCILSVVGPWSAMNVSERNQISRFEKILIDSKKLVNGKIDVNSDMSWENHENSKSVLLYLYQEHEFKGFKLWLKEKTDIGKTLKSDSLSDYDIIEKFGLKTSEVKKNKAKFDKDKTDFNINDLDEPAIPVSEIKDFDFYLKYSYSNYRVREVFERKINKEGNIMVITYNKADTTLKIAIKGKPDYVSYIKLTPFTKPLNDKLINEKYKPLYNDLMLYSENDYLKTTIILENINWNNEKEKEILFMDALIYVKIK
ncbi:MAG: DUF4153 domain-containing protein [Bacteroidota bacterium]